MKKILVAVVLLAVLCIRVDAAVSDVKFKVAAGTVSDVYYDAGATATHVFIDGVGNTPDLMLEINGTVGEDVDSKYVGVMYGINMSNISFAQWNLTSKCLGSCGSPYHALVQTGSNYSCGTGRQCANTSVGPLSMVDVLVTDGYGIDVALSAYPGNLWAVISDNESVEDGDTFVYIPTAFGRFKGSFSTSSVEGTYDQTNGDIRVDVTAVTVFTGSATSASMDSNYQANTHIATGVCQDANGTNCNGTAMTSLSASTINLLTGVTTPDDQSTHTKYLVANGLSSSFCIGTDLQVRSSDLTQNTTSVYYGQGIEIKARVYNARNVNVTTDFNLSLFIDGVLKANWTVTETIANYSTSNWYSYNWTASVTSGTHNINASADAMGEVVECAEDSSNNRQESVTVNKLYIPYIYINDTYGENFSRAGVPHNVSIFVNDTDGSVVDNGRVRIYERNNINIFAPLQNWSYVQGSATRTGLHSLQCAEVRTNDSGWTEEFTLIPTYNPIFDDHPDYELGDYIGNYSFYLTAVSGGNPCSGGTNLTFSRDAGLVTEWTLYINNHTYDSTGFAGTEQFANQGTYVQTVLDWVYEIFAMFRKLIMPV